MQKIRYKMETQAFSSLWEAGMMEVEGELEDGFKKLNLKATIVEFLTPDIRNQQQTGRCLDVSFQQINAEKGEPRFRIFVERKYFKDALIKF